ncbi:MAG: DUF1093 domain-containing protein [Brooklawnia sp.]|nr:DUF1093 domain-containing protein [Brooklawnia sp.]
MKKQSVIVAVIVIALLVLAGVVWAKQYYDSRYIGQDYYTVVPLDEPVAVTDLLDSSGNPVDKGYAYKLVGFDTDLNRRVLEFDKRSTTLDGLYQPGTYLRVSASAQIVLNETVIQRSDVPPQILEKL